jgi:hypothetical protein
VLASSVWTMVFMDTSFSPQDRLCRCQGLCATAPSAQNGLLSYVPAVRCSPSEEYERLLPDIQAT